MGSLADNIRARMAALKMTQKDLADKANISQVMVHKLVSGKTTETAKIIDIAKALRCDPNWLKDGVGDAETAASNAEHIAQTFSEIPILSTVQARGWAESEISIEDLEVSEKVSVDIKPLGNMAAFIVQGDSMISQSDPRSLSDGTKAIVDSGMQAKNGDIVLAMLDDGASCVIKQLVVDGPNRFLKSLNIAYPMIQLNEESRILGVVRGIYNKWK